MAIINIGENGSVTISTFLLLRTMVGAVAPFIIFFAYGLFARGLGFTASAKLATGWGLALFGFIASIQLLVIFCAFWGEVPKSADAFVFGYLNGSLLLTAVVAYQAINNSETKDEADRLRKEAYSF